MIKLLAIRTTKFTFAQLLSKIFTSLTFILVARRLSPSDAGLVIISFTYPVLLAQLGNFGLVQFYQKQIQLPFSDLFNQVFQTRIITYFLTLLIQIILNVITPGLDGQLGLLSIILLTTESLLALSPAYYLNHGQTHQVGFQSLLKVLPVIFVLTFSSKVTPTLAITSLVLGSFITTIFLFPWKQIKLKLTKLVRIKEILISSKSYALLVFTSAAYNRADHLVIQAYLNSTMLGLYSAAYRYLESASLIPTSLNQLLFPHYAKNQIKDQRQFLQILTSTFIIGLITSFILYFSSDFLTSGILGSDYSKSSIIVKIFSLTSLFMFINAPLAALVQSSHLVSKFLPFGIMNTILNIILNLWLIPFYGILAAAWVMTITEFTGFIINLTFARKVLRS